MNHRPESAQIRLTINGEQHELDGPMSVAELLEHLEIDARHTAVERNRELVPKVAFDATRLADGDVLEIVTLVGGG